MMKFEGHPENLLSYLSFFILDYYFAIKGRNFLSKEYGISFLSLTLCIVLIEALHMPLSSTIQKPTFYDHIFLSHSRVSNSGI